MANDDVSFAVSELLPETDPKLLAYVSVKKNGSFVGMRTPKERRISIEPDWAGLIPRHVL
jgi:hypothetical protein